MAFVNNHLPGGTDAELCSGTVVAPNVVLTAGHCAVDLTTMTVYPPAQYSVITRSLDWTDTAARQTSAVSRIVVYPGFLKITGTSSLYADGDAALLQLTTPTAAPSIAIASDSDATALYAGGTPGLMAGWGLTSPSGTLPTQLQTGNTVVQNTTYCQQQASRDFGAAFDSFDQICSIDAPTDSTSTCHGDSGGPLIAGNSNGTPVEIAITSWSGCTGSDPDYYTRVDRLSAWITNWIAAMALPTVTTGLPSNVASATAQLNGQVDPNGQATTYSFQWGPTASYGHTAGSNSTNDGSTILPVSTGLTGLQPGTTYHYRLVGTNTNGTTDGGDETFTTAPGPVPGRYRGATRQRWPISLRVRGDRLTALSFSFGLRCTSPRHRQLAFQISPLSGGRMWSFNTTAGLGFSHTFTDNHGARYSVAGRFSAPGRGSGTLDVYWRTHKYGTCRSGTVSWSAKV